MKKIALIIALIVLAAKPCLADSVIDYDLNATPVTTDQLIGIDNPGAVPGWSVQRFSIGTLFDLMEADISGFSIHVDNLASGGITDGSILEVDGSPNDGEFAVFTTTGIDGKTYAETRTLLDVEPKTKGILDLSEDEWTGKVIDDMIAGESMTTANRWGPVYIKYNTAGPRVYLYNPDSADADNDTYKPVGLLYTNSAISAGNTISITSGSGMLRNDTWSFTYGTHEGKSLYCSDVGDGYVNPTAPSGSGDHFIRVGTILSVEGGIYYDVIYFDFGFVDLVIP